MGNANDAWRELMKFQVDRARAMMISGKPLGSILTGRIGLEMRMIIAGGLRILAKLEKARVRHVPPSPGIEAVRLGYHAGQERPF